MAESGEAHSILRSSYVQRCIMLKAKLTRGISSRLSRYFNDSPTMTFSVLAALARLAHKYEVSEILAGATCRLQKFFSRRLVAIRAGQYSGSYEEWAVPIEATKAIEAVNLFRTLGSAYNDSLAPAFYLCCGLDFGALLRGLPREDGAIEKLGESDVRLCFRLKNLVAKEDRALAMITGSRDVYCRYGNVCGVWVQEHIKSVEESIGGMMCGKPLGLEYGPQAGGFRCGSCQEAIMKETGERRKKFWDALPAYLSLDDAKVPATTE